MSETFDALKSLDTYTRLQAVRGLSQPEPRSRPALAGPISDLLIPILKADPDPLVRAEAAWVLGERGGADAIGGLADALANDTNEDVRATAAGALSKLGGVQAKDSLLQALGGDPSVEVRLEAVRGLARVARRGRRATLGRTGVDLEDLLRPAAESDPNPAVRRAASAQLESQS